ncbi:MAG: GGDEF domain-containing protein [Proteobacteria bacterium]|nr:MAG: GGDEF domain-containing protein [Pseudomonadota bacterium]QKK10937.1 MAG: GGDEF domain-containing protein [Pseudomonadota bacterium]
MSDIELQRLSMEVVRLTRERDEARRLARRLDQSLEMALRNSTRDELSGMINRRAGAASFHVELGRGLREGTPTALLVLDLDEFKQVNDRLGHDRGDALLARVSKQIGSVLREYDVPIRWGGDEFCIILPNTDAARAEVVGKKVLRAIRQTPFDPPITLTASCGVAVSNEEGVEELMADIDLENGRIDTIHGESYNRADVIETMVSRLQRYLFKVADLRCYCAKHRYGNNTRITGFQCQGCAHIETKCVQTQERDKIRRFYWRQDGSKWLPQMAVLEQV